MKNDILKIIFFPKGRMSYVKRYLKLIENFPSNLIKFDILILEDFKINNKTCVMKGKDWEEKISERSNGGHEMNMGLCFQYYNPTIKDYIASRINEN